MTRRIHLTQAPSRYTLLRHSEEISGIPHRSLETDRAPDARQRICNGCGNPTGWPVHSAYRLK